MIHIFPVWAAPIRLPSLSFLWAPSLPFPCGKPLLLLAHPESQVQGTHRLPPFASLLCHRPPLAPSPTSGQPSEADSPPSCIRPISSPPKIPKHLL